MKKFHYILLMLFPILTFIGCSDEELFDTNDKFILNYKVSVADDAKSRAVGDGTNVNQLIVGIFEEEIDEKGDIKYNKLENLFFGKEEGKNKFDAHIPLFKNKNYSLVFWAQNNENKVYDTNDLSNIRIDYSKISEMSLDDAMSLDAFSIVKTGITAKTEPTSITLERPFTMISTGANGGSLEDIKTAELTLSKVYTSYQPLAGTVSDPKENVTLSFKEFGNKTFEAEGETFNYMTVAFLLVNKDDSDITISGSFKDEAGEAISTIEEYTVESLEVNYRNHFGKPLTEGWDGTWVDKLVPDENDGIIHIANASQLLYLLENGYNHQGNGFQKFHLCKDLDMRKVKAVNRADYVLKNIEFNGGGFTLYNLPSSLFGESEGLIVKDLTLKKSNITSGNINGALAVTVKGSASFTNVTIENSSISATNIAGGIVGYISRINETTRSESLEVTFDNCHVKSTELLSASVKGKMVGKLSGYDNNEVLSFSNTCTVADDVTVQNYSSQYIATNQSVWLEPIDVKYNGWLGTETYRRGVVTFDEKRLVPKWDGSTTVEPIYDDNSKKIANIWSPFDLAYLGGKSLTTLYFKTDVDMAGVCNDCKDGEGNSTIANDDLSTCAACKAFNPIIQLNNLYGENHTLYNLFVQGEHEADGSYNDGMGFIRHTNSGTFNNFTFDGAIIKCIDDKYYRDDDEKGGNGYAGTLTSRVAEKMTISNVHAKNGHVIGISKFGGLIGYVPGGIEATNCTVDNYVVENHKINVNNSYSVSVEKSFLGMQLKAECSEDFFTEGEAGGFIGFISSNATITNCHTYSITMKCYGIEDRDTKILTYRKNYKGIWARTYIDFDYTIAGRHVNTFIGDIRTPYSNTVVINGCTTSGNCANGYDYNITKTGKGELVGCCYFVGKDIEVLGKSMHAGDYKGSVTIDGEEMPFVGG